MQRLWLGMVLILSLTACQVFEGPDGIVRDRNQDYRYSAPVQNDKAQAPAGTNPESYSSQYDIPQGYGNASRPLPKADPTPPGFNL